MRRVVVVAVVCLAAGLVAAPSAQAKKQNANCVVVRGTVAATVTRAADGTFTTSGHIVGSELVTGELTKSGVLGAPDRKGTSAYTATMSLTTSSGVLSTSNFGSLTSTGAFGESARSFGGTSTGAYAGAVVMLSFGGTTTGPTAGTGPESGAVSGAVCFAAVP